MQTTIQVLSADERAEVHERTLRVLETCGVRVDTPLGRAILAEAGAEVDEGARIVRLPRRFVEECLALAPHGFSLGGRRDDWTYPLGEGRFTLLADGGATSVIDRDTLQRRLPTQADWLDATRVIDVLDDVGLYWCMTDYPQEYESAAGVVRYYRDTFTQFGKHVQDSLGTPGFAPWLLEVLDIVFGGREEVRRRRPFSFLVTPASPLIIERSFTETWLALRGWGIPVAVMPMPLMGATAPGSRLGTVLSANCETIATLCLVQAAEPGTPVIYAPVVASMDPRTGRYAGGAIEHYVLSVAAVEMARHYGLPVEASGCGTDHFVPSIQAAYEKAAGAMLATLPWPDVLVGPGLLAGAMVLSLEQIVFDVEVFRMARHAHQGITVSPDAWLDEVLARIGPGGSFLGEASTRHNLRGGEWSMSDFGLHDTYEAWEATGAPSSLQQAHERVDELLAAHEPARFSDDVETALDDLQARADAQA